MATAVQPTAPAAPANPRTQLLLASFVGAAVILAGLAAAAYVVPLAWDRVVTPVLAPAGTGTMLSTTNAVLRVLAQGLTVAGFAALGATLAGRNPPVGVRGGIFLVISALITVFFIGRAVGLNLETSSLASAALPVTLVVVGALLGLMFRLLSSDRGVDTMRTIDEQGLLSTNSYKRTQGLKARRYTLIGLLIVGLSGVYSLIAHNMLDGNWLLEMPFLPAGVRQVLVLPDLAYTAPILLAAATVWLGWRIVNMPSFADFLIATEAEMNKVSWASRRRLFQDTIVVLVTLLLMTLFFLVVDFFWGWLLSREFIGVLPSRTPTSAQGKPDPSKW